MTHPPELDWTPPRTDQPSPPPPRDPTRIWLDPATTERAQGIRSDAIATAAVLLGDCSGTPAGIVARLVELAEPIAAYIRDGTRPEPDPEVYHSIQGDPQPPMTTDEFETHLAALDANEWHP